MYNKQSSFYEIMRYLHSLAIDIGTIPKNDFEDLCQRKPEGRKPLGFYIEVVCKDPTGDEIICRGIEVARKHGLRRRYHASANSYGYHVTRWYDDSDLANAELLILGRQTKIQGLTNPSRDAQGRLLLAAALKSNFAIGRVFPNWVVVSDRVKRTLETARLVGLFFFEVAPRNVGLEAPPAPIWEVRSTITLPKMANMERFIHPGQTEPLPFQGDYSQIVMLSEPPFDKGEVHYRRSDLTAIGPFDIGSTYENYLEPHPALVISKRFYQLLVSNRLQVQADPVRLD